MMERINSYGKVYNLGHAALKDLFSDVVTLEEKVDGSQFSFGIYNGELKFRSRNKQIQRDCPEKLFIKAVESVEKAHEQYGLKEGYTYRGEYLQKPKHNTICYNRIPNNHIVIFDIDAGLENYLSPKERQKEAERIGFESIPVLKVCSMNNFAQLKELLQTESFLGGSTIEGVVIKNFKRFGSDGKFLKGKFVSEAFKERNDKDWKCRNPKQKDIKLMITEKFRTKARWQKAVQHLKENNDYTGTPRDIRNLIKEVQQDIKEECEEEIKEILFKWAWKDLERSLIKGLPEWYKEYLAKENFNEH